MVPVEALGPKIQGLVSSRAYHVSIHSTIEPEYILVTGLRDLFDAIRIYLETHPIEGIVWHDGPRNRYAKIKRRDFGLEWPVKNTKRMEDIA